MVTFCKEEKENKVCMFIGAERNTKNEPETSEIN